MRPAFALALLLAACSHHHADLDDLAAPDAAVPSDAGSAADLAPSPGDGDVDLEGAYDAAVTYACTSAGTWEVLPSPHRDHERLVSNGTSLFRMGGYDDDSNFLTSITAVDESSGTSATYTPAMPVQGTTTLVGNTLVVLGGQSGRFDVTTHAFAPVSATGALTTTKLATSVGSRVFAWDPLATKGALYDPVADTWSPASSTGAPPSTCCSGIAYAGGNVVLWGSDSTASQAGWSYSVATDTWSVMPTTNAPSARTSATVAATSTAVVVFGGESGSAPTTGARWSPATNTWSAMSSPPASAHLASGDYVSLTMGSKIAVVGESNAAYLEGGVYDPASDTWAPLAASGAPIGRNDFGVTADTQRIYVTGGTPSIHPTALSFLKGSVYAYDVASSTWSNDGIDDTPYVASEGGSTGGSAAMVWAPSIGRALLWSTGFGEPSGGSFDPASKTWSRINVTNAPLPSSNDNASGAWDGSQFLVYAGTSKTSPGATYDPTADTWTTWPSSTSAPTARTGPATVWTGTELFVYGASGSFYAPDGTADLYDPAAGTWSAVASGGPGKLYTPIASPIAIDGGRVAVWGGEDTKAAYHDDGYVYDPTQNTWTAMTTVGAPSARGYYTAVWTGTELLVWGGLGSSGELNDGALYNPTTDSWRPMSTAGAPKIGAYAIGVWTGTRALLWGGQGSQQGGFYDPTSDTWGCMPTLNAPTPRDQVLGLWTGTQLFLYAGLNGGSARGWLFTPN